MLAVLTTIAIVAGAVLAYVNSVTAPQIEKINADNLAAGIKAVMGADDIQVAEPQESEGFTSYAISDAAAQSLGVAVVTTENGFGGPLKVLVGFDNEGNILGYTVLEHAETPGLGAKAGDWFQKTGKGNIIGMNPGKNNFTVSKDGGEIDAITASTITSRAFLKAIKNAYEKVAVSNDGKTGATKQAYKQATAACDGANGCCKAEGSAGCDGDCHCEKPTKATCEGEQND